MTEWANKPNSVVHRKANGDHSSGRPVTRPLERPTRSSNETGRLSLPIWACWRWGLPCRRGHPRSRCALTAPFHPYLRRATRASTDRRRRPTRNTGRASKAVCFLWHCPSARAGWPLATTVPCPVRTFLPPGRSRASDRLAHSVTIIIPAGGLRGDLRRRTGPAPSGPFTRGRENVRDRRRDAPCSFEQPKIRTRRSASLRSADRDATEGRDLARSSGFRQWGAVSCRSCRRPGRWRRLWAPGVRH